MAMKRDVITGVNHNWIIGFREELVNEKWERSLHSDWVFGLMPHHHAAFAAKDTPTPLDEQAERARNTAFVSSLTDMLNEPARDEIMPREMFIFHCEPNTLVKSYVDTMLTLLASIEQGEEL